MASAKSILDEGISFDVAVVDLLLADGNASTLAQVLSERGIAVVIATGDVVCEGQPAHSKAITILQKPSTDSASPDPGKCDPSGMPLAHDIGLARLPLGVERIE